MQITIIKKNKLNTINLPEAVVGTHWITDYDNGKKVNLLSVEAENEKWKLISNDDTCVIDNKNIMIPYVELKENSLYLIRNNTKGENYYLYCSEIYDKTFKEFGINENNRISVGFKNNNSICYKLNGIPDKAFNIEKDNECYVLNLVDKTTSVYVNKKRVTSSKKLEYGDIIFIFGLKIILMRKNNSDYLLVNNPNNLLEYNTNFVNVVPVASTFIEDNQELSEEQITNEINYFYRTPLFYGELTTYNLKIDAPPQKKEEDKTPAVLTIGPMITMAMTSVVMLFSTISSVSSGEREAKSATTSIIMCVAMLASSLLWPLLTRLYQKFSDKVYENKRQRRYKKYIEKKEKEIEEELQKQRNILINNNLSIENCQKIILNKDIYLWQKRITDENFLTIPVGIGNRQMQIEINYPEEHFSLVEDNLLDLVHNLGKKERILNDVPITFSFYKNITTGIVGDSLLNKDFVDRIMLQLMANYSYDELKIVTFTSFDNEADWEYLKTLPHSWSNDKSFRFFGSSNDDYREIIYVLEKIYNERINNKKNNDAKFEPHYVIVTDSIKSIDSYDFIKNVMQNNENLGFSIIILVDKLASLPNECKNFIEINKDFCTIFSSNDNKEKTLFNVDYANIDNLYKCSKALSNIPLIIKSNNETSLPDTVHFLEMYQVGKVEQLNSLEKWKKSNPILSLQSPIGVGKSGELITLDLHEKYHGPHGLVAGTTGSGKSEFIITYILSLAVNYHPFDVQIILIDYKGGSLAGAFQNDKYRLPHLAGTITNLDGNELNRSLASIESEVKRRQAKFNEARNVASESTMDIYKYQKLWREGRLKTMEPIAHLFIISDEFAELKEQQPEFMEKLISIARVGRSLGVHLILATQKPGGVVDQQIWSNTKFRVCLKVQDTGDSQEVIKKPDAAYLKKTGRFYLQVGTDEIFTLGQSAWAGGQYYPNTTFKKDLDVSINLINNIGFVVSTKELDVKEKVESMGEELPNIVKYIADIAKNENINIRKLWLDKIPEKIYIDNLIAKYNYQKTPYYFNPIIGEYDDPNSQNQYVLTIPFSKLGNAIVYGINGSGKEEFIQSLLYSVMQIYSVEECNYYILDFGAETLKIFEKSYYCGGIGLLNEEEKIINLFKMLEEELDKRKKLFANFGGNYQSYIANSGTAIPNKLVIINNYEAFAENFDELTEKLTIISREAYKYGIYFLITASSPTSVRLKTRNNFSLIYALQQNNDSDYSDILGNCRGKIPAKNLGRGLFKKDSIFEFQTAFIKEDDPIKYLLEYLKNQNNDSNFKVDKIPVMPDEVTYDYIKDELNNKNNLIVGINKNTLALEKYCITKNIVNVVSGLYLDSLYNFAKIILKQLNYYHNNYQLFYINASENNFTECSLNNNLFNTNYMEILNKLDDYVNKVYEQYEKSNFNSEIFTNTKRVVIVIYGVLEFLNKVRDEGKQKLANIVKKAMQMNNLSIILFEEADLIKSFAFDEWFKQSVDQTKGIWVGSGIVDQSIMKLNKVEREDREEITNNYGYIVEKGRASRVKLVTSFDFKDIK